MAVAEFAPLRVDRDPEVGTSEDELPLEPPRARRYGIYAVVTLAVVGALAVLAVAVGAVGGTRGTPAAVHDSTVLMYPFRKNKTSLQSPCATVPPAHMPTTTPSMPMTTTPKPQSPCATAAAPAAPVTTTTVVTTCPPLSPCATVSALNASFGSSMADYFVKNVKQVSPAFQQGFAKGAKVSPCDVAIKTIMLGGSGNTTAGSRRLLAGNFIVHYSIVVGKATMSYDILITQNMKLVIDTVNEVLAAMGIVARIDDKGLSGSITGGATTTAKSAAGDTFTPVPVAEPEPEPEPEA